MRTVCYRWGRGQRLNRVQIAEWEERRILKIGGCGRLPRLLGPRHRGSRVTKVAPLLLSDAQTLSVTQEDAVCVCDEALQVTLWVLWVGDFPFWGYSPVSVTLWLLEFRPWVVPRGLCLHILVLADIPVVVSISCPSYSDSSSSHVVTPVFFIGP